MSMRITLPSERTSPRDEFFDATQRRIRVEPFVTRMDSGRLFLAETRLEDVRMRYRRRNPPPSHPQQPEPVISVQPEIETPEQIRIEGANNNNEEQQMLVEAETFYDASDGIVTVDTNAMSMSMSMMASESDPSPEYKVTLDRHRDVLLFDPRVLPILRINKTLLDTCTPDTLSELVGELLEHLPSDVDPLTLPQLQDKDFFKHLPRLLVRQQLLETRRYEQRMEAQRMRREQQELRSFRLFDDVQSDLAYALMLSLKELVSEQRTYNGFRYRHRPAIS